MINSKELREYSKSLKLLYVEDDNDIRESTTLIFENFFTEVVSAVNGLDGLEKFKEDKFDIIVTDIRMPHLDGISMIKEIKNINEEQIIIVTSAYDESSYLIELIELGVDGFILKPIKLEKFLKTFYKICKNIIELKTLEAYRHTLEELEKERAIEESKNNSENSIEF